MRWESSGRKCIYVHQLSSVSQCSYCYFPVIVDNQRAVKENWESMDAWNDKNMGGKRNPSRNSQWAEILMDLEAQIAYECCNGRFIPPRATH